MMFLIGQLRDSIQIEDESEFLEYPAMLTKCLELLSAFSGMERENINRGLGWLFMSIGRRLERAIYLTRQLREIHAAREQDWSLLECMLEVADSSMTYRTRYYTTLQPLAVLDVLMADETNPRSLDFQLSHLRSCIRSCRGIRRTTCRRCARRWRCCGAFDLREIQVSAAGRIELRERSRRPVAAGTFPEGAGALLPSWSNNLSSRYFSHARTLPITIGQ